MSFVEVARVADVGPGSSVTVFVGEHAVALCNVDGTFYAVDGVCLHRGGPVGDGDLDGAILTCPWHGWQYDVRTGSNLLDPRIGLRRYAVRVSDDRVLVALTAP